MKYDKISRRHFLVGTGAITLSLPYLVSLMPNAHAQSLPNSKFLIFLNTPHGGLNEEYWAPRTFPTGVRKQFNAGSLYGQIQYARLQEIANTNGLTSLWQSFINPYLGKMNILEGFDIPFYIGHHRGLLGTYHNSDQLTASDIDVTKWDSLDYFLSKSTAFDSSGNHPLTVLPTGEQQSYFYNSTGMVRCPTAPTSAHALFTSLFGNPSQPANQIDPALLKKKSIIDRVLMSYNGVVNSAYGAGKRISYNDKQMLDEHLTGLRELEVKINNQMAPQSTSCTQITRNPNNVNIPMAYDSYNIANEQVKWDIISDLIVNAVRCGSSRLFSIPLETCNTHPVNDFHEEIAHQHRTATVQEKVLSNYRNSARDIFTTIVKKLDSAQGLQGGSVLDQGLVVWSHESCSYTHQSFNMPVVTAGSAGGYFKTGYHVDFRNPSKMMYGDWGNSLGNAGIHYNRWLANIAMAMGASPSSFEKNNQRGYGPFGAKWLIGTNGSHREQLGDLSSPLPFIVT